jgi:hypothetical protein
LFPEASLKTGLFKFFGMDLYQVIAIDFGAIREETRKDSTNRKRHKIKCTQH